MAEVEICLKQPLCLGLDHKSRKYFILNLTKMGGIEKGISHQHAHIMQRGDTLYIIDLGSMNGTFVNGQQLSAFTPQTLEDNTDIQLGKLMIHVCIP